MRHRLYATLPLALLAATSSAAIVRQQWIKNQPFLIPPNENILLRAKDLGGGLYGVYGNLSDGAVTQPMFGRFNRYGVHQASGVLPGFLGDIATHFMDYTDDSCMSFRTTLFNGRPGIGVARINQAGNTVYRTTREINTYNGFENIIDSAVDPTSGAIYVLGEAQASANGASAFLAKFNANGSQSWVRSWYQNDALDLLALPDGSVVVSKLGNFEIQMVRVLSTGTTAWTRVMSEGLVDPTGNPPSAESISFNFTNLGFAASYRDVTNGMDRLVVKNINVANGSEDWEFVQQDASATNKVTFQDFHFLKVNNFADVIISSIHRDQTNGQTTARFNKVNLDGTSEWTRSYLLGPLPNDHPQVSASFSDPYGEHYFLVGNNHGLTHLLKYAPNGTRRWDMISSTPGGQAIQCATMLGFTDILISSYSFGATDTGNFMMVGYQQSAVALNDNYSVKMNAPSIPSTAVIANDRYAAGATITVTTPPANGTVVMYSNGIFRYTPNNGFQGQDTFTYTLSKPGLDPSSALVRLNVQAP